MEFLDKRKITVTKIASIATDGAASMTGKKTGFITRLKYEFPWIIHIHCLAHQMNLAAK